MKPGALAGALGVQDQPQTPTTQSLSKQWMGLEFGKGGGGLSDEDKRNPEWESKYLEYVSKIEDLSSDHVPPGDDLFWWKSQDMMAAAMIAPQGPMRDRAVIRLLGILSQVAVTSENVSDGTAR